MRRSVRKRVAPALADGEVLEVSNGGGDGCVVRAYLVRSAKLVEVLKCRDRVAYKALCKHFKQRTSGDKTATKWWTNQRKWVRLLLTCTDEQLMTMAENGRTVELAYSLEVVALYLAQKSIDERIEPPHGFVLPTTCFEAASPELCHAVDVQLAKYDFPAAFRFSQALSSVQFMPEDVPRCFGTDIVGVLPSAALKEAAEHNRNVVSFRLRAQEAKREDRRKRKKHNPATVPMAPWERDDEAEGHLVAKMNHGGVDGAFHEMRHWLHYFDALRATEDDVLLMTFRV